MIYRLLLLISVSAGSLLSQYHPPEYRAGRTVDTITVDGRLDEFTWAALPRVGKFSDIRRPDRDDLSLTQATIAWDSQKLYIAFACEDSEAWGTMYKRDDYLWEQEVVEVFLDPDGDGKAYAELEISPHNVLVDLLIPRKPDGAVDVEVAGKWNIAGLQTATAKHARGWTVEIAIPWASLADAGVGAMPKWGDRWRVGLYRIERPGGAPVGREISEISGKIGAASGDEKAKMEARLAEYRNGTQFQAWSPTLNSFHEPERFGVVEFVLKP